MNRFAVTTLALALAAASGSAFADSRYNDNSRYDSSGYGYEDSTRSDVAQVTSVSPILEQSRAQPRQECWNEPAPRYGNNGYDDRYDNRGYSNNGYNGNGTRNNNVGGTVLGAIVGGALGNQAGKGDGRKAATIAGAVLGGAIGNGVARNNDRYNDQRYGQQQGGTVQRCRTVSDNYQSEPEVVGYDVTYRYAGQTYRTTTPYHPGKTIRVAVSVRPEDNNGVAYR